MESRKIFLYLACIVCLCFLMLNGCKEKPMEPDSLATQSEAEGLQKTVADDMIYKELDKIAKFLAEKRASVVSSLPAQLLDRKGEELLSQLSAARSLQNRFIGSDGRVFNVNFALAKRSPVDNLAEQLRVAVDPDDHPMDGSGDFVVYFLDAAGKLSSETTSIEEYNQKAPYPLLLVNAFEEVRAKNSLSKAGPGNSVPSINSPFYLSVTAIDLKRENDATGYEEFEIFIREESIPGTVYHECSYQTIAWEFDVDRYTNWLFDGHYRFDEVGRYRYFPDINVDEGGWITMQDIALVALTSGKKGLTPIEDDQNYGEHNNRNTEACYPDGYYAHLHKETVYAYRWDLGRIQGDLLDFRVNDWEADPIMGGDDIYTRSGFFGVTQSNCQDLVNDEQEFENTDMDMRLLVEDNPQIPLNPPVITGSIKNGHPKLTWSAVPGADAYKVTLYDTYASQTLNWTIYTTSFEDPPRYPVVFSQIQFPSLEYSVRTIDNGLESDFPSNSVLYQYDE